MKEWIKKYTVYIVIAMMYYFIPLYLVKDTGSGIFLLLMVIPIIVFFAHILLYIVTLASSIFKSATESSIDPVYLSLIGLVVQLIITISLLLILF